MPTDYAKKERAFLDRLKPDTGHTLDEWMVLIAAEHLNERNDLIDWLRQHGFTFSRASWLERIYHNGGQPIYADTNSAGETSDKKTKTEQPPPPDVDDENDADEPTTSEPPPLRVVASNTPTSPAPAVNTIDVDALDATLAGAKGLRPLAQHLVREIQSHVPEAEVSAGPSEVLFRLGGTDFAFLAISPKDLRLGLALPNEAPTAPFVAAKFAAQHARKSENMTHMLAMDDVRQIDPAVIAHIKRAGESV